MKSLDELGGYAFHRYGVFIDTFNNDLERQEIKAATMDAWVKGQIRYESLLMINGIDDPKKAGMILSFEKWRELQEKKQEAAQAQQNLVQIEQLKHQNEMELAVTKGKLDIEGKNVEGRWYYEAHKAGAEARITAQQIRQDNEPEKISLKTDADIKKEVVKNNLKRQDPL